ncbi:superinfection immunity protein [Zavarzinella formosa]|uniref:superinfection immunity protein n=1 Tax=Zavarzinella formosa TaxID=360055 RepID=UPI000378FEBE|nr:superinfection immunity protein [Zavarzinella formosa]
MNFDLAELKADILALSIYVWAIILPVYFFPTIVAVWRGRRNCLPIFLVNLFLGFMFIGWVLALVWATLAVSPIISDKGTLVVRVSKFRFYLQKGLIVLLGIGILAILIFSYFSSTSVIFAILSVEMFVLFVGLPLSFASHEHFPCAYCGSSTSAFFDADVIPRRRMATQKQCLRCGGMHTITFLMPDQYDYHDEGNGNSVGEKNSHSQLSEFQASMRRILDSDDDKDRKEKK